MVAIVFRTTGAWGVGQGFNLTNVQVDTNFYNLKTAVEFLQNNPPEAVSIDFVEMIGNDLFIHLTDYSVQGPFPIDGVTYTPRGIWQPSTVYAINDLVSMGGTLYVVTWDHTSDLVFDPGANDGAGHNYYEVFFEAPETSIPIGGNTRDVLGKNSATDFDIGWLTGLVPDGGAQGALLRKASAVDQDLEWFSATSGPTPLPIKTVTTSIYTFQVGDEGQYIRFTVSGAFNPTFPTNASQPFAIGSEITFRIVSATSVFMNVSVGVTITPPTGFLFQPFGPGAVITIKKTGTNTWDAFGLLAPQ